MRTVIPENLVSVYDISVPYAFDMRKVRRRLDAEIEKLHPRFPDRCVADYRLRFQPATHGGSRFHIRAFVMDRFQLAAIRKENEGCMLYAAGAHPYPVFSRDVMKKRVVLAAAAVITVLAAVILLVAVPRMKAGGVTLSQTVPVVAASEMPVSEETDSTAFEGAGPAVPDFSPSFSTMYEYGGTLLSLSLNADDRSLSILVEGLFPEQLSAMFVPEMQEASSLFQPYFGQVTYQDGVPTVPVTLILPPFPPDLELETAYVPDAAAVVSSVRKLIQKAGGQLASETVSPPSLSGSVPLSAWMSFAPELSSLLNDAPVRFLEFARGGADVSLSFTLSESGMAFPFTDLLSVFDDAPGLPHEPAPEDEWVAAKSEQREIGCITRNDGTSVVFFHNADGKIERRVYEN